MQDETSFSRRAFDEICKRYDVLVVGAGPAGIMAAVESARVARRVLLVDAGELPRRKSCGGMLNAYSRAALEPYGSIPSDMVLDPSCLSFRYVHLDRGVRKPTGVRFLNVDRTRFDEWLLGLLPSSVEVADGVAAEALWQEHDGVRMVLKGASAAGGLERKEVRAKYVIAAGGPRATVRRRLGMRPYDRYVTVQDYFKIKPGDFEPCFDCIYSRAFPEDYGIGYIIPKGDAAIVGSVFYPSARSCRQKQREVVHALRREYPFGKLTRQEVWMAARLTCSADIVAGDGRVLLAGEEGGFLSSTSGEGISFALNSGIMAGRAVAEALGLDTSGRGSALACYEEMLAPMMQNLKFRMAMFPFMDNDACKDVACFMPTWLVSKMTERL